MRGENMRCLVWGWILLCAGVISGATLLPGTPMREVEDRAAEGETPAIAALRDSAAGGSTRAMNFLGFLYWQGKGARLDRDSALLFLRRAAAKGDAKASANLGHLMLTGADCLPPDTAAALKLLDYAASRRSCAALRELADYFETEPGDSACAPMLKKVADAYSHGHCLKYNFRKSIIYYKRAAELGDTLSQRIIRETLEIFPDILKPEAITPGPLLD